MSKVSKLIYEENILHRLLFLKLIAVDVEGIITPTILTQNFMKVSSFAEKCPTTPIESYVTLSCLWRILGIWSIQTPQKEMRSRDPSRTGASSLYVLAPSPSLTKAEKPRDCRSNALSVESTPPPVSLFSSG